MGMMEEEVILDPVLTLYVRTRINNTGLFYAPAPVLEVLRNTSISIDLQILDLSFDKDPYVLENAYIRFIARKLKYPVDTSDIFVCIDTDDLGVRIMNGDLGMVTIDIAAVDLHVTPSDYWYDLQLWTAGKPLVMEDFNVRQPLQKFIVLP